MTAPATTVNALTIVNEFADVTADTNSVEINRGRYGQLFDAIDPGNCAIRLNNEARTYDPLYADGDYFGVLRVGASSPVQVVSEGLSIFFGSLADIRNTYEVSGRSIAAFIGEDRLAILGRKQFDEWTATASQTAGPRLTDILARDEVQGSGWDVDFDDGVSTLQGDLVTWGSNVLNYCQLVAKSDLGYLFADRLGVLTFRDRHATASGEYLVGFTDGSAVSDCTTLGELLTEDGDLILSESGWPILTETAGAVSTIPFHGVTLSQGSELFFNRVSVDAEGFDAQTATDGTLGTNDGIRSLTVSGLLLEDENQCADMADFLLGLYKNPETRINSLTVKLEALTATQQQQVLALDVTSLVCVTWTPNGVGDEIDRVSAIQGVEHRIGPASHHVTFRLMDVSRQGLWTIDDPVYGLVDANNVIGF